MAGAQQTVLQVFQGHNCHVVAFYFMSKNIKIIKQIFLKHLSLIHIIMISLIHIIMKTKPMFKNAWKEIKFVLNNWKEIFSLIKRFLFQVKQKRLDYLRLNAHDPDLQRKTSQHVVKWNVVNWTMIKKIP